MSVESQTAGKNDEVSNEADLANDVGHVGSSVDKYLIVKDDFSGSVSSASDNIQSDLFSIKTPLDSDCTSPSKVRRKSGKAQAFVMSDKTLQWNSFYIHVFQNKIVTVSAAPSLSITMSHSNIRKDEILQQQFQQKFNSNNHQGERGD